MYIGKLDFKKAFLISALWHFLLGVIFVITINPAGFSKSRFSTVSFLGPILQETQTQKGAVVSEPMSSITQADIAKWDRLLSTSDVKVDSPGKTESLKISDMPKENAYKTAFGQLLNDYKEEPRQIYSQEQAIIYELSSASIEGQIKEREIIYKPASPPKFKMERAGGFYADVPNELSVEIGITVAQDGKIEAAEVLKPTGNKEFDLQGTNYVKEWLFVPIPAALTNQPQRGTVVIRLNRSQ